MGPQKVVDAADRGRHPRGHAGPGCQRRRTLGTASVHNIDMATPTATFAAQGQQRAWHIGATSKDAERRHALQGATEADAGLQQGRMADVDLRAAAGRAARHAAPRRAGLGRPAAGKTGTAALRPDTTTSAWFVGFTPQLCAAVDFYKGTGRATSTASAGCRRSSAASTPRASGRRS